MSNCSIPGSSVMQKFQEVDNLSTSGYCPQYTHLHHLGWRRCPIHLQTCHQITSPPTHCFPTRPILLHLKNLGPHHRLLRLSAALVVTLLLSCSPSDPRTVTNPAFGKEKSWNPQETRPHFGDRASKSKESSEVPRRPSLH